VTSNTIKLKIPSRSRLPKAGLVAAVIGAALVALAIAFFMLSTYVSPDQFAIRQVYLGPKKGMQQDVYGPGRHFVLPGYERLHLFPRDLQLLEFNKSELAYERENRFHREDHQVANAIKIQTSEGYQVAVDVTVMYRVIDPYVVVTRVGTGTMYEESIVEPRADRILRQTLGQLNAEDFYSDRVRMEKAEEARQLLQEDLEEWGIQVWGVLIREYTYDDRYQQAIEERKIQDQKVFKNMAEAIAASREAEKNKVLAEGKAFIEVERERGRSEIRKIYADADLYYRQKEAGGDLLVALAEAKGTKLENQALQQAGASNMVGLEMAEALKGIEVIIVSTSGPGAVNPLDLDQLLEGW
jgi:regulator of protease activity HflC (stomatin/prohibitin superfamily)